jgi:ribosomal RNA-processing protein 12
VVVLALDEETLRTHLPILIEGLLKWSSESKNHFREKVRIIFQILFRRFTYTSIRSLVPSDSHKFIDAINKTKEREKRQKAVAWREAHGMRSNDDIDAATRARKIRNNDYENILNEDEDPEGVEEAADTAADAKARAQQKSSKVWLREGDYQVDFTGSDAARHIATSDPSL